MSVTARGREEVAARYGNRCAYCRCSAKYYYGVLEIEHIIPLALGGTNELSNHCQSCRRCNAFKSDRITAVDHLTGETVRLFNPSTQVWSEHFIWDGALLTGLTICGRATVESLRINDTHLLMVRQHWMEAGWHPPEEGNP